MTFEKKIKKEYILDGLSCAHCANKIENDLRDINGISNLHVNFITKSITFEIAEKYDNDIFFENIKNIVKEHSEKISLLQKNKQESGKKTLYLDGLDCAQCAIKIENELKNIRGISSASVDFVTRKLTIEAYDKNDLIPLIRATIKTINDLEPNVKVYFSQKVQPKMRDRKEQIEKIMLIAGVIIFAFGMIFELNDIYKFILFFTAYILTGHNVILRALRNITKGKIFDENFLMSLATIGAFLIGEYPEGVAVMLFYQIGEIFQARAVNNSRKSISKLMDIRADFANLKINEEIQKVNPETVCVGDIIVVKPGEKVPLDGIVVSGFSMIDLSALNGESLPKNIQKNDEILSGSINKTGLLHVRVTKEFSKSTVSKILDLVQNASSKKAKTENFITKFARYYTPFVVIFAFFLAFLPPLLIEGAVFSDWVHRALVFLVISCPCALVISVPLSFFGGIGGASKNGILIKGSNYLEALNSVNAVVFDKTGTLTKGIFDVVKINSTNGFNNEELLFFAAHAESFSNHPISSSIIKAYGKNIEEKNISSQEEIAGFGVKSIVNEKIVLVGNSKLMQKFDIYFEKNSEFGTIVYIAIDGIFAGSLVIRDEVKEDSKRAISELKRRGIQNIVMLTGDNEISAKNITKNLGIDKFYANLLPDEKVKILEEIMDKNTTDKNTIFVGDGINDAPSLARANIGVAMGGVGSDAAIEAADIVLMKDEPIKLVEAIDIAKKTRTICIQNIIFALSIKGVLLIFGALGIATMWEAVFGDVGVTLIAILNSARTMKTN